jgi:hypothetical protein
MSQKLVATHELEREQQMLLEAFAEVGIDPDLALEIAREPMWIPAAPQPEQRAAPVLVLTGC